MVMPRRIDIDLDDADNDGICASQTPGAAGNLTLDGAIGGTLDYARIICIYSAGNLSGLTFNIYGTDENDAYQEELSITGPNNSTVASTKFFKTVTRISISGAAGAALIVGTRGTTLVASSRHYKLNHESQIAPSVAIDVTGTISVTVQECYDNLDAGDAPQWFNTTSFTSKSADTLGVISRGATGLRVLVNSYSSGAEVQVYVAETNH